MAVSLDQIVEETREMPGEVVAGLIDRIMAARHGGDEPSGHARRRGEASKQGGRQAAADDEALGAAGAVGLGDLVGEHVLLEDQELEVEQLVERDLAGVVGIGPRGLPTHVARPVVPFEELGLGRHQAEQIVAAAAAVGQTLQHEEGAAAQGQHGQTPGGSGAQILAQQGVVGERAAHGRGRC